MPTSLPPSPQEGSARVTLVVSFRERWSLTLDVVEAIVRHSPRPYRFWLLDTGMPPALRTALEARRAAWGLELVTLPPDLWPNQARAQVARQIDTPYAIFIDNDVLVHPGWLEALLDCADETGAGIVGPLYLWGEDANSDLIHMAGGELMLRQEGTRTVMGERHRHINTRMGDLKAPLRREVCDFAEFHCLLMRREILQAPETFDPDIVCVHEHIHASLVARQLGYDTWMEPAARVFYFARSPWHFGDLPDLRRRWSGPSAERSLRRFASRWNVIDDARSFGGVRGFVRNHVEAVDPLRMSLQDPVRSQGTMGRADLEQTPAGLLTLALQRTYSPQDLQSMYTACKLAMRLSNGSYRPCGRPFFNHLIGTASVLVYYGFGLRMILTALLHAAYSHARAENAARTEALKLTIASALGGTGSPLERSVKAYALRKQRFQALGPSCPAAALLMDDLDLLLLEAANDIDMHLSLEVAVTGRNDLPDASLVNLMVQACQALGIPGMGQTLREVRQAGAAALRLNFHAQPGSFRLQAKGTESTAHAAQAPAVSGLG